MRTLTSMVLLLACGAMTRADQKQLDRNELDRRVVKVVYEAALLGTEVFNDKKHDECYRLYQGTLLAVLPMLDHRPKLAAQWVGEHSLPKAGHRIKDPDAFLRDPHGNILRVIESTGRYGIQQVQSFHDHCEANSLPYELW